MGVIKINTLFFNNSYYAEGYADGYAKVETGTISYVYHEHSGNSSAVGGCYNYIASRCTGTAYEQSHYDEACNNVAHGAGHTHRISTMKCNKCGFTFTTELTDAEKGNGYSRACSNTVYNQKIGLACGKSTSTIESAVITFD